MKPNSILPSYAEQVRLMGSYIETLRTDQLLQILEAGCGQRWPFSALPLRYTLTGVDLDPDALEIRKTVQRDLDEGVVGDLRTVALPENYFHAIYSSYVLEHVKGADVVLKNFVRWLKPGGMLIMCVPDRRSVSGFLTRFTPHWLHIFVYRFLKGYRLAGTPGHGPYRTYYDQCISAGGIVSFAAENGLEVRELRGVKNETTIQFQHIAKLVQYVSLGQLRADYADLVIVLQKN